MSHSYTPVPTTPVSVPLPVPVSTPPMMWLSSLPSSVLSWCLATFLTDTDAVAVATCSKESLDAMQRAPYYIKNKLWWTTAETIARLPSRFKYKAGVGVWLSSSPQFRFGQPRRTFVSEPYDAVLMTSLIASLPKSVNELQLGCLPNTIVYPMHITSLLLNMVQLPKDNAPLDLPPNLHTLTLPQCPDHIRWQDVVLTLPDSLHTLRFGDFAHEKRSLKDFPFPPHLTELNMGQWKGPVAELPPLPTGLRTLVLPSLDQGVRELAKRLPSSLTELVFNNYVRDSLDDVEWPPSLRSMQFSYRHPLLNWRPPPALETLDLHWHLPLSDLRLPATLQRLNLWGFRGPVDASYCWPSTLRALHLRSIESPLSDVQWPVTLEVLELSEWNCPSDQLRLPPRLRKLRFGLFFNQSVADLELPSTLEWLGFGVLFNQPVEGVLRLPMRLQQLHFGSGRPDGLFDQPLTNMQWPSSLQSLFLPSSQKLPLEGLPRLLPPSLRALHRFESDDANIESAWTAIVASLPRCQTIIIREPMPADPCSQQISFELFK